MDPRQIAERAGLRVICVSESGIVASRPDGREVPMTWRELIRASRGDHKVSLVYTGLLQLAHDRAVEIGIIDQIESDLVKIWREE